MTSATALAPAVLEELRAVLEEPPVTDRDLLEGHRRDMASFCPAGVPAALVRPRGTAEVSAVLRIASAHRIPVVPQGGRTGLSGAANAVDGALLLSLARMETILEIDVVDQVAVVQPGVTNAALSRAVGEVGLFYAPDPSSWESSTIGGNVATNAGGLCCVKYGVTGDFVRGLEVVLADGEVIRTGRRTVKGVAGYDLTRLLVGSEGTLGVITEVTLGLRPAPEPALTAAATFSSPVQALEAASEVMAAGLRPSLLEMLDGVTLRAVQSLRDFGLEADLGAMLLAQSDRPGRAGDDVARIAEICHAHGARDVAVAEDAEEAELLLAARRSVNAALELLGTTLVDDVAVPRSRLAELMEGLERIAAEHEVVIACPGHVGDGNMHPTVVFDRADPDAVRRAEAAFGAVMDLGLALHGTITGEHGVGRLKSRWLREEVGERGWALQRGLREVFDPAGILNPGAVTG